ncbi:MAG TPA: twin-arginine translocase TatA/TatE family subunit [Chitinophagaceae bacterium]|jgi:sec-independent protein translocase protein TatA|nr:twin-arginine translocase TatA/TatE family subunit [Chitinophagaceae bacterium]
MYSINLFAPNHLLLLLLIVVLLFGAKKIPDLMRGVGKGMKEFKDAKNTDKVDNDGVPVNSKS